MFPGPHTFKPLELVDIPSSFHARQHLPRRRACARSEQGCAACAHPRLPSLGLGEPKPVPAQVWSILERAAPRLPQPEPASAPAAGAADAAPAANPDPEPSTAAAAAAPEAAAGAAAPAAGAGGAPATGAPAPGPGPGLAAAAAEAAGGPADGRAGGDAHVPEAMDTDGLATLAAVAHLSPEEHEQARSGPLQLLLWGKPGRAGGCGESACQERRACPLQRVCQA